MEEGDKERIEQIVSQGHSRHCACRQVWGDGECECSMYEKGYDPYAWAKGVPLKDIINSIEDAK